MSLTINVRSTKSATISSVTVEPTTTIAQLKAVITEQCNLGLAATLVFKGKPLRDDSQTLQQLNFTSGDTVIGVFKAGGGATAAAAAPATPAKPAASEAPAATFATPAAAPAAAATVPAAPVKSAAPAVASPVAASDAAVKATTPKQEAPKPAGFSDPWACPMCTYINIPARTICEMCGTEDPVKAEYRRAQKGETAPTNDMGDDSSLAQIPPEAIDQRISQMGVDTSSMSPQDLVALRDIVAQDLLQEFSALSAGAPIDERVGPGRRQIPHFESVEGLKQAIAADRNISIAVGTLLDIDMTPVEEGKPNTPALTAAIDAAITAGQGQEVVDAVNRGFAAAMRSDLAAPLAQAEVALEQLMQDPQSVQQLIAVLRQAGHDIDESDPVSIREALLGLLVSGALDIDNVDEEDAEDMGDIGADNFDF